MARQADFFSKQIGIQLLLLYLLLNLLIYYYYIYLFIIIFIITFIIITTKCIHLLKYIVIKLYFNIFFNTFCFLSDFHINKIINQSTLTILHITWNLTQAIMHYQHRVARATPRVPLLWLHIISPTKWSYMFICVLQWINKWVELNP